MSKTSKIFLSIIIVVVVIAGIGYFSLIPSYKINEEYEPKKISVGDFVKATYVDSFEARTNPIRLMGTLSTSDEDFKDVIYTLTQKYEVEELKNIYISVEENKIKIIKPYKILGFINTQYTMDMSPSIKDSNLVLTLSNLKIGKIKLSDNMLGSIINSLDVETIFTINNNVVTIDKSFIKPITLKNITINSNKIILDVELQLDNLIDFIKEYEIKVVA